MHSNEKREPLQGGPRFSVCSRKSGEKVRGWLTGGWTGTGYCFHRVTAGRTCWYRMVTDVPGVRPTGVTQQWGKEVKASV